jgi:hypothetical protein
MCFPMTWDGTTSEGDPCLSGNRLDDQFLRQIVTFLEPEDT